MGTYRKHLSGDMAFRSFVPTPLSEIRIVHTERLDKLIMEVEDAMRRLNAYAVQLSDEQVLQFMRQELNHPANWHRVAVCFICIGCGYG